MKCSICGKRLLVGINSITTLKDGVICNNCATEVGLSTKSLFHSMAEVKSSGTVTVAEATDYFNNHKTFTFEQERAQKKLEKKQAQKEEEQQRAEDADKYDQLLSEFKEDKAWHVGKVYFDDKKQQVLVKKSTAEHIFNERTLNFPYSDLESYDVIEDPTTIEKKHGVGRSIVGGLVAGPTGAVLGAFSGGKSYSAVSKVAMILYFKENYHIEATFLSTDTSTSSSTYAAVQRSIMQVGHDLDKIIADNNAGTTTQATTPSDTSNSTADDLRELKQLLDDGIITQDDFDTKKKQILGI
ncbi:SHOCT domain-containing protein [Lactiplantibacillus daowaiensis]|uniref:SHOCT domain-containing protein n=1 Tax=Lactiplantibacillus daowaiensis TaxID=2559918 RepID=A0ABW1RX77_9LACO|nr:SHOCT domain-containing protein [Lactiplantibacillus daowaiensis]